MSADVIANAPATSSSVRANTVRPFYWSLRRELWENRSLFIAPAAVAGLIILGFLIAAGHPPRTMTGMKPGDGTLLSFAFAFAAVALTGFLVAVFYCLGALYDERRDRSILFWKSMPVSDLTSVLAKVSVPMVVLPVILLAAITVVQFVMLLVSTAMLSAQGHDASRLWSMFGQLPPMMLYALVAAALWTAPFYGWLLLVSAFARRAPFMWAVLPPLGLGILERVAFGTHYVGETINDRLFGWAKVAFVPGQNDQIPSDLLASIDAERFFTAPGLWIGLAAAAALVAASIRLRRYRGPI